MEQLTIAIAGPEDVDDLARLRARWTDGPAEADAGYLARYRRWWFDESGHRTFWLARRTGVAVGMANLVTARRMPSPDGADRGAWGYLGNMFVVDWERNRGVGRRLLAQALAHADAAGVVRVMLNPTERSRSFYARAGFVPAADGVLVRPRSG